MSLFKILVLTAVASLALLAQTSVSKAQDACEIIHRYEAQCGNLDPDTCIRYRQGFDYWNNAEHRVAWNDFYNLCGQDTSRDSHECVAYLGIADRCTPSVEAQPEPVMAYQQPPQYQVAEPGPEPAMIYQQPIQYQVLQPGPEPAVVHREPIQYQVCCQIAQQPQAEPAAEPVENPVMPVENPVAPAAPVRAPSIPEGPEGVLTENDIQNGGNPVSGKVVNEVGGSFQMSGAGCSFQGPQQGNFPAGAWTIFLAAFALLGRKRICISRRR